MNEKIQCAVERPFLSQFSEIELKVGDKQKFLMGFHVYAGLQQKKAKWQGHSKKVRIIILDHTNFSGAVSLSLGALLLLTTY